MDRQWRVVQGTVLALAVLLGACRSDATDEGDPFTIEPGQVSLDIGATQQLSVDGTTRAVTWSSSASGIASVVATTGLVTGVSRGEATITAVSGADFASATVRVTAPPAISLSAPTASFEITRGDTDPTAATVNVTNAGDGTLSGLVAGPVQYSAGQPGGWLTPELSATTAPATLSLRAAAGTLPAGDYAATVPVAANGATNSPQHVAVTFRIVAPASIVLSRTQVAMNAAPGGTPEERVDVTNGGGRALTGLTATTTYGGGATGWLAATLTSTSAPAQLVLNATTTSLAQGTYTAQVTVASSVPNVAAQAVTVTLTVGPGPAIALSQTTVPFTFQPGGAPQVKTVSVTNAGGGTLTGLSLDAPIYVSGGAQGWLTATIAPTTAPAAITLNVNPSGLAAGTYTARVPVRAPGASNSPLDLNVTVTIGTSVVMSVNPHTLNFSTFVGGSLPSTQAAVVTSTGGTAEDLAFVIVYNGPTQGWLGSPTWQNGDNDTPATLLVRPTAIPARGSYGATITIVSGSPGVASISLHVNYTVSSFSTDILPLFANPAHAISGSRCTNCHVQLSEPPAQAHAWLQPLVVNGQLQCKITGGAACTTGTNMRMSAAAIDWIQRWIAAGAPAN
jgi:Bacterial Ig-like domain (group 2)